KSGSRTDITNYRPISLLSCFSKIFEKVMQARLVKHLKLRNILYASQYGFSAGHSCEHALLEAQHKILRALERKRVTALLLLDFSKAFDAVSHETLLHKLEHYGVRGLCLSWFKSYLTDRRQYVHVNNCNSTEQSLKYGVPQGSILGPVLFIIYINDMPSISPLAHFIFFADDANLIISADTYEQLNEVVNIVLKYVENWVANNGLMLNAGKTKYMIFTNKARGDIDISIYGKQLKKSDHERFLGVIIDSKLNWTPHITHLKTKISRNAGVMYKLKGLVPSSVLKMLYNSFIQSHVYYCSPVWGTGSYNSIKSLFSAQKKGIRAANSDFQNYRYNKDTKEPPSHTKGIFNTLEILSLPNLIAKTCLCLMHKVYMNVAPKRIVEMFDIINCTKPRRDPQYFCTPYNRLRKTDYSIVFKGPKLYNKIVHEINNTLPHNVPQLQNKFMDPFKANITKYLLSAQKLGTNDVTWQTQNFILYGD
ncbi:MAG: reverse transcriptase family protein, partial [Gammaproteobacteria bacterium]|nr:reverse transcriptase family protein [Gammaproteobacteria bacterium]